MLCGLEGAHDRPGSGMLFSENTLGSLWFSVLAAFVAVNTVMYVALAVAKILPKVHPRDWLPRTYVRAQTRSIYPDRDEAVDASRGRPGAWT